MRGRKPKDLAMKLLSGNASKRPLSGAPSDEPFVVGELKKPRGLDKYASREWDRLVKQLAPILSPADEGALFVTVSNYSLMMRANAALADGALTYTTESKKGPAMTRERREVGILQRASRDYQRNLSELGATPVGHTRVKKLPEDNQTVLPGMAQMLG